MIKKGDFVVDDVRIQVTLTIKDRNGQLIILILPKNERELQDIFQEIGISYTIEQVHSNCKLSIDEKDDILLYNKKLTYLDMKSNAEEVSALMECFNYNFDDLMKVVKEEEYRFYPNKTLDDILSEIEYNNGNIKEKDDLFEYGYYELSNGVLKVNW